MPLSSRDRAIFSKASSSLLSISLTVIGRLLFDFRPQCGEIGFTDALEVSRQVHVDAALLGFFKLRTSELPFLFRG
ncbi:MAG: hypothetical protein CMO04_16185 [Thalassospira sp.]|nr:hypothetical protein [Thalassospira sp.]